MCYDLSVCAWYSRVLSLSVDARESDGGSVM